MTILNMLWCHLPILMHRLFLKIWWMMSFLSISMVSWFVTPMTSSFSQRTWRTMNTTYIWFWRSFKRLDFMPNFFNVNSINLKWNSQVTSFLEMAFTWIFTRFKPLLIGLLQLLFEMSNVSLNLPTFINVSLPIILQQWPLLLGWLRRINFFLGELKLIMPFNLWIFFSQLPHS